MYWLTGQLDFKMFSCPAWARHMVLLSTQVYELVLANLLLGVTL